MFPKIETPKEKRVKLIRSLLKDTEVTIEEVMGISRKAEVVAIRHEVWYVMRYRWNWTFKRIGEVFGGIDHSSVVHGVKKHESRIRNLQSSDGSRQSSASV